MPSIAPFTGTLSRSQAAHLLHRAALGFSPADLDAVTGLTASDAVDVLYDATAPLPAPPVHPTTGTTFANREELSDGTNAGFNRLYVRNWFLKQMVETTVPAREKMVLFWHTHFTNDAEKTIYGFPLIAQNQLFRQYAYGSYKTLCTKICRDYAMSVFLDGWRNYVTEPNENFAREFLELYSIGKGEQVGPGDYTTFTEDDVREAARVLTGYIPTGFLADGSAPAGAPPIETDPDTGLYRTGIWALLHDVGTKTFSARFQNTTMNSGSNTVPEIESELDAFIDMVFAQDATAEFIVRKLYRFFCYYEITPAIEADIIQPLAADLRAANYEVLPVLKRLLRSQHFYDADDTVVENDNIGAIVKSPIELIAGAVRYFGIDVGDASDWQTHHDALTILTETSSALGMVLFDTPEVAGYPAYHQAPFYNRNWISADTLVNRYSAFSALLFGIPVNGGALTIQLDSVDFVENGGAITDPSDPNEVVDVLTEDLFPVGVDTTKRDVLKDILLDGMADSFWTAAWADYTSGGPDGVVRTRLNALFRAILQSPEFQLS